MPIDIGFVVKTVNSTAGAVANREVFEMWVGGSTIWFLLYKMRICFRCSARRFVQRKTQSPDSHASTSGQDDLCVIISRGLDSDFARKIAPAEAHLLAE